MPNIPFRRWKKLHTPSGGWAATPKKKSKKPRKKKIEFNIKEGVYVFPRDGQLSPHVREVRVPIKGPPQGMAGEGGGQKEVSCVASYVKLQTGAMIP